MLKKLKIFTATLILQLGMVMSLSVPVVMAQSTGDVSCGSTGQLVGCDPTSAPVSGADVKVNNLIKNAIRIFQIIVGLISVFMIITGGLKYITSGGDSSKVGEAKNAILYAVIGLVVVGIAQIIVQFALNRSFGSETAI